jgi:hypothetical protein
VIAPAITAVFEIAERSLVFADVLSSTEVATILMRESPLDTRFENYDEFFERTREGKLHFVQVRAHISCYFFGDLVWGAAINSAFRLALSCSTAARTRAIA